MSRTFAHIISFVAHPLLVLSYILVLLLVLDPYAFGARRITDPQAMVLLISVFVCTFVLPGFAVALMKPLGLIKSLQMHDKQDRIGPYIVSGVFFLWLVKNLLSDGQTPRLFVVFTLGATIGLFLAFLINIFSKISAHAVGMGGFVAMLLLMVVHWNESGVVIPVPGGILQISLLVVLALGIVLAGLTGTARLVLRAHEPADVYRGYVVGILAVLIANLAI
ncbi:MAG: hypothetical protein IT259_18210 [Saprospiraceae bacterium]|nr:hypothetical protein [Saprospiraceae bacterium]